jgi:phosphoglucosamine mutase
MKKYFGTDGVRGIANENLTPQLAFRLGKAACLALGRGERKPGFVIGKDTRIHVPCLKRLFAAEL